ncbi:hypothetical protein BU24DRAFT_416918 [Aaosphaeria arxii CBS 175.79]|uniref:Transmembrane protein n=1 Tax=Aaosphaeria arxii CBS 175.79 TaxID=1450172 RepID=A0A6A5Y7J1_9PLEO|nr:uncharacterized protein BU24DRAFT_416918 [Aaosphaeria arxii CBS 175.79]KAF2021259.1 hypothetical protein BU24DRAFT_416918 [Aaosphaeria arxii CBS 175.79]
MKCLTSAQGVVECYCETLTTNDSKSDATGFWLTVAILILTFAIEWSAFASEKTKSAKPEESTTTPTPDNSDVPAAESQPTQDTPQSTSNDEWLSSFNWNVSPQQRATRFVLASFLMIPCLIAFVYRIKGATNGLEATLCNEIDPPNWALLVIFSILPFACSVTAWLRTLVDCILSRWNRHLNYWWPCLLPVAAALFGTFMVVCTLFVLVRGCVLILMGRSESAFDFESQSSPPESVELSAVSSEVPDEERGLMHDVDAGATDDDATVYSPRSSVEEEKRS